MRDSGETWAAAWSNGELLATIAGKSEFPEDASFAWGATRSAGGAATSEVIPKEKNSRAMPRKRMRFVMSRSEKFRISRIFVILTIIYNYYNVLSSMKIIARFQSILLISIAIVIVGCSPSDESDDSVTISKPEVETIVFGIYTADKASAVVDEFAPIIEWLETGVSEKLGRPVEIRMKIANEYLQGISDVATGAANISRLGPASYTMAKDENPDLELLAMEAKNGERSFKGIICVHKDSPLQSVEELKGKSFAFGDPLSTIGRYLSQGVLLDAGIVSSDLERFEFLGRHDTVGMAVAAGDFTAGALKSSTFKALVEEGQPLRKLVEFDNVTKPWVAHPSLKQEIRDAIRACMLEISEENAAKIDVDGFATSADHYYDSIREAIKKAQEFQPEETD